MFNFRLGAAFRRALSFAARSVLYVIALAYALGVIISQADEPSVLLPTLWAAWVVTAFVYKYEWDDAAKAWVISLTAAAAIGYLPALSAPPFALGEGWLIHLLGLVPQATPAKAWVLWVYQQGGHFVLTWAALFGIACVYDRLAENVLYPSTYNGRHVVILAFFGTLAGLTWVWLFPTWGNTLALMATGGALLVLAVLVSIGFDDEEPLPGTSLGEDIANWWHRFVPTRTPTPPPGPTP